MEPHDARAAQAARNSAPRPARRAPACVLLLVCCAQGCASPSPLPVQPAGRYVEPAERRGWEGTTLSSWDFHGATSGAVRDLRQRMGDAPAGRLWSIWFLPTENYAADRFDPQLFGDLLLQSFSDEARGFAQILRPDAEELARVVDREQRQGERSGETPPTWEIVPDFILQSKVRALERNPRSGISRWYVITFSLSDLDGVERWRRTVELKKSEERPLAYQ